ncbi:MAG TPA: DNA cytosine methyltransferase [Thermoanaerobaculia bacterium]|nr:DNA cytosine methyltransferase [Thermoanaerobaculia bacterium]
MREAALLQTFPKRYKLPLTRGKYRVAQMIGNALPPEFIRRHAGAVRRYLEEHGPR